MLGESGESGDGKEKSADDETGDPDSEKDPKESGNENRRSGDVF